MVGLYAQSHRHDGDDGGDRQQRNEDPGAFPQRCDAVVFALPGGVQVVAGGVQPVAEAWFGGQGFGVGQPGASQQPGFVAPAGLPVGGGALQGVGGLEVLGLVAQPGGQFAPLPQQAFQRDLDDDLRRRGCP